MDLFEGGDEGFVVIVAVFVGEGFACAEFFEQVIHAGDGDVGMGGLDLFAVGVEAFAEVADVLLLGGSGIWEGKRVKRPLVLISGIVSNSTATTCSKRPSDMNFAGEHTKEVCIIESE